MIKTLDKFKIGESGTVVSVTGERKIKRRLYDMGIPNGAEIYLRKKAVAFSKNCGYTDYRKIEMEVIPYESILDCC